MSNAQLPKTFSLNQSLASFCIHVSRFATWAVLCLMLLLMASCEEDQEQTQSVQNQSQSNTQERLILKLEHFDTNITITIKADSLLENAADMAFADAPPGDSTLPSELLDYELLDNFQLRLQTKNSSGEDPITLLLSDSSKQQTKRLELLSIVGEEPLIHTEPNQAPWFRFLQLKFPHYIQSIIADQRTKTFIEKLQPYLPFLRALSIILLLYGLLRAVVRFYEYFRRKRIEKIEKRDQAPYIWGPSFPNEAAPDLEKEFSLIASRLQGGTAGVPAILSEQTGYLLLIDHQDMANHRAKLFDSLYLSLRGKEVKMDRYFYDRDLRLCYNEEQEAGIHLEELAKSYSDARLLIVGNGRSMLSNSSGTLMPWTEELFKNWKVRAILNPIPTDEWGAYERQLGQLFSVLPASLQALDYLVAQLDGSEEPDLDNWREHVSDAPRSPITLLEGGLIYTLRQHYPEEMVKWIAACAVYPDLNYQLTCQLGDLLSGPEGHLLTSQNISELNRLAWFVHGEMPQSARAALLEYLELEHPSTLLEVRHFLHTSLPFQPPPSESVAASDHSMRTALNEWHLTEDPARKKVLEREIHELQEAGVEPDFTIRKVPEYQPPFLISSVPDAWRKPSNLFVRLGWLDLNWLLPLALSVGIFTSTVLPAPPPSTSTQTLENECPGLVASYHNYSFCLSGCEGKTENASNYAEFLWRDLIEKDELDTFTFGSIKFDRPIDWSLLAGEYPEALENFKDTCETYFTDESKANLCIVLYNRIATIPEADSALACYFLDISPVWCSSIPDIKWVRRQCEDPSAPIAGFIFNGGESNCAPYALDVSNYSRNANRYFWDFGDGNTSTDKNPSYTYDSAGDYQLQLIVERGLVKDTMRRTLRVTACKTPSFITPGETDEPGEQVYSGLIFDSSNNQPINNANIRLQNLNVNTNTAGQYTFKFNSDAGTLQLQITAAGYRDTSLQIPAQANLGTIYLNSLSDVPPPPPPLPMPEMVFVQGGTFSMGCLDSLDNNCTTTELPSRQVNVGDFLIGKYEVTVREYKAFAEATGTEIKNSSCANADPDAPISGVSWDDANAYCAWLSQQDPDKNYRLPTEAEWEFAARGGTKSKENLYAGSNNLDEVAWHDGNSPSGKQAIGKKTPNELGIFDMSGNVYEWCADDWHDNYLKAPKDGSAWIENPRNPDRLRRGGSFKDDARWARSSYRVNTNPRRTDCNLGFRVVAY